MTEELSVAQIGGILDERDGKNPLNKFNVSNFQLENGVHAESVQYHR